MEIAIALDGYDDLFSDFDIRSYGERAISRDFLDELGVRLRKSGTLAAVDLVLLLPAELRRPEDEARIVERLRAFFAERRDHYLRESRRAKARSLLFVAIGLFLSFVANLSVERLAFSPLLKDFFLIPAWFFVWNGLELFLRHRREIGSRREYYASLAASRTVFKDIDGFRR